MRRAVLSWASATALALLLAASGGRSATDVEVREKAGDVISSIAEVVRDFRLTDVPGPVEIEASTMEFSYQQGRLSYHGHVKVHHGEVELQADSLLILFDPGQAHSLRSVRANGRVKMIRGKQTASGQQAVYDPKAATITLSEHAQLASGPNLLKGQKLVVYLKEKRAVISGGKEGPVHATLEPRSAEAKEILK